MFCPAWTLRLCITHVLHRTSVQCCITREFFKVQYIYYGQGTCLRSNVHAEHNSSVKSLLRLLSLYWSQTSHVGCFPFNFSCSLGTWAQLLFTFYFYTSPVLIRMLFHSFLSPCFSVGVIAPCKKQGQIAFTNVIQHVGGRVCHGRRILSNSEINVALLSFYRGDDARGLAYIFRIYRNGCAKIKHNKIVWYKMLKLLRSYSASKMTEKGYECNSALWTYEHN
jgi:hypothetical protein